MSQFERQVKWTIFIRSILSGQSLTYFFFGRFLLLPSLPSSAFSVRINLQFNWNISYTFGCMLRRRWQQPDRRTSRTSYRMTVHSDTNLTTTRWRTTKNAHNIFEFICNSDFVLSSRDETYFTYFVLETNNHYYCAFVRSSRIGFSFIKMRRDDVQCAMQSSPSFPFMIPCRSPLFVERIYV